MSISLFNVSLFLLLPVISGCSLQRPSPEIVFVLPDGFKGLVILDSNDPNGYDPTPVNNVITLSVDKDGNVSVKGNLPTIDWHRLSARYENGDKIPQPSPDRNTNDDDISAFREAGLYENRQDWFVVGTQEDLKKAVEKKQGFKWP